MFESFTSTIWLFVGFSCFPCAVLCLVAQSCPTLCYLMDCSPLCLWGFSSQEYWSWLPFPPPGDLSDPRLVPRSPTLQVDSLPSEPPGRPKRVAGSLQKALWEKASFDEENHWFGSECVTFWDTFETVRFPKGNWHPNGKIWTGDVTYKSIYKIQIWQHIPKRLIYNVILPFVSLYVITQIATKKRTTQAHLLKISKDSRLYVASLLYVLFMYYTKTAFFAKKYLLYANKFTVQ